jgi:hypothetical protein
MAKRQKELYVTGPSAFFLFMMRAGGVGMFSAEMTLNATIPDRRLDLTSLMSTSQIKKLEILVFASMGLFKANTQAQDKSQVVEGYGTRAISCPYYKTFYGCKLQIFLIS